jgi:hypothetical protein
MAMLIYGLCALTAFTCACLLLRAYARSQYRLLLWSGLCFVGLTLNNVFLIADKLVFPEADIGIARSMSALIAMSILIYGLVWDAE